MYNILILGGKSKFGAYLATAMQDWGTRVMAIGRPDVDFSEPWVSKVETIIRSTIAHPKDMDFVIINAYDWRDTFAGVQSQILDTMWGLYKDNPRTTVVVIGSLVYHDPQGAYTSYGRAKKALADQCAAISLTKHEARLLLVEPGPLENRIGLTNSPRTILPYDDLVKIISKALTFKQPYLQLGVRGMPLAEFLHSRVTAEQVKQSLVEVAQSVPRKILK